MTKTKTLFLRFSSLGDVIIANYTAMKIKEAHPDWHLTWMVDSIYLDIVKAQPWVDEAIAWDRRRDGNHGFIEIIKQVRCDRYDILIDMHGTDRSSLFSLCSGIPIRYCSERRFPFTHTTHNSASFWDVSQKLADCSKYLCVPVPVIQKNWIPQDMLNGKLLMLAIGASFSKKRWPVANWVEFCKLATNHDYKLCLLGSGSDEVAMADAISSSIPENSYINLVGKLSLLELVQVIDCADLMISGDTGSLHIARALGKPVVAMFGPTTIDDKAYIRSLKNIFTCDCPKYGCELFTCDKPCMETIAPRAIMKCIKTII